MAAFREGKLHDARKLFQAVVNETEEDGATGSALSSASSEWEIGGQHKTSYGSPARMRCRVQQQKATTLTVALKLRMLALRNLGEVYEICGKMEPSEAREKGCGFPPFEDGYSASALRSYAEAVRIDSGMNVALLCRMGRLALDMGKHNVARRCFEHGLSLRPLHPLLPEMLMDVLQRIGDTYRSKMLARRVLRKKPNHAGAKRILQSSASRKTAAATASDEIMNEGAVDCHAGASASAYDEKTCIEVHVGQQYCETWTDVIQDVVSKMEDANRRNSRCAGSIGTTARCKLTLYRDIVTNERTCDAMEGIEVPATAEGGRGDAGTGTSMKNDKDDSRLATNAPRALDESAGSEFAAKNVSVDQNADTRSVEGADAATAVANAPEAANASIDAAATDAAATTNTSSMHENNKENKPALRQSTRQSARVKQAVLEDSMKECEHGEKAPAPTPVIQLSEEAEKKLRPFVDEMSQGERFGELMAESCAAAMDASSSRDSGALKRLEGDTISSTSKEDGHRISDEDMDAFVTAYGSEWASLERFGAALLEFIGEQASCIVEWDDNATQCVLSLERRLRHSASQSLPVRRVRTCLFVTELLLRDAENSTTGTASAQESADDVAAGYLFNVGLIHAQIASGELDTLSVDTETRMHRCASLWARINRQFQESVALMRMAKAVLLSSPASSGEETNSIGDTEHIVRLPHIRCEMSSRSIDAELTEIQSDVLVESAKAKPALLESSAFLRKFSGALFSRRYTSARDLLLSVANFRSDRVKVLDLVLAAAESAEADPDIDVPTRRFLAVAQLRAHIHTSMIHLLVVFGAERDGTNTAKTPKQRTKDVPLWLSNFSGKNSALRSILEKMNAYLERLRTSDKDCGIFRESVSSGDGILLLEMKTLASMLLEHFIRAWRDETSHKQGASTKLSVRLSGTRVAFTIFAESLLHLYECVLAQEAIDDKDVKDAKMRNLFAALQDCLGSLNVCTARDCSFLRLGVSMLRKKPRSDEDGNKEDESEEDSDAEAAGEEEEAVDLRADPIDQAIYDMLGIPLCHKDRLVEHGITHQKLRATKEGTYVSDPGYLPPASVAIDVWEHLDHFMDCVADEERCSKKKEDVSLILSPTLELIAPHVKADMDRISEKLRAYMDSDAIEDDMLDESTLLSFADDAPPSLAKLKATYFTALWECRDTLDPLETTDSRRLLKNGVEDIVEGATSVVRADIVFNPRRFRSWSMLGRLYDVAADILINDGAKLVPLSRWSTATADGMTFSERAELYKRRCLRCWTYAYKLASKHSEREEVQENMALLHFERSQNTHPVYSQRGSKRPLESYMSNCVESTRFFSLLDQGDPGNWFFSFHLGKLAHKMKADQCDVLMHFARACTDAPECLEAFYRLHATRLKYLLAVDADGKRRVAKVLLEESILQRHMFYRSWEDISRDTGCGGSSDLGPHVPYLVSEECAATIAELGEAGRMVLNDCVLAMERCLEVGLYYKARVRLARTFASLGASSTALEILSVLFKNKAGSFDVNMYEIGDDIISKRELVRMKSSRKQMVIKTTSGQSIEIKGDQIRHIGVEETGRKYVSAVRRILVFYLRLCCELEELDVLASATTWLRSDRSKLRQFLGDDLGLMAEVMYMQMLRMKSSSSSLSVQEQSACYTMYMNAYMYHSSSSQHFCTMAAEMDTAIRNGEILWPNSTMEPNCVERRQGLTEISIECFLSEHAFAYVSSLQSSDEVLALLSSLHDNCSVERMQPLLSPCGLVHHIVKRVLATCSGELESETASASSINRLRIQDILTTCKAVRDFYLKYVLNSGASDMHVHSADNTVILALEDLMIQTFRMCQSGGGGLPSAESGHGNHDSCCTRAEHMEIVVSFCDALHMTKMNISPIKRPQPSPDEPLSNPSRGEDETQPPSPKRSKHVDEELLVCPGNVREEVDNQKHCVEEEEEEEENESEEAMVEGHEM